MNKSELQKLNDDYQQIQEAQRSNRTFQAVTDILNELITKRSIHENIAGLERDTALKTVAEYDSLLYDVQELITGIMGVLGQNETALSRAEDVINQLKGMMKGGETNGTTKNVIEANHQYR